MPNTRQELLTAAELLGWCPHAVDEGLMEEWMRWLMPPPVFVVRGRNRFGRFSSSPKPAVMPFSGGSGSVRYVQQW